MASRQKARASKPFLSQDCEKGTRLGIKGKNVPLHQIIERDSEARRLPAGHVSLIFSSLYGDGWRAPFGF